MSETPGADASAECSARRTAALDRFLDTLVPAKYPTDAALARAVGVDKSLVRRWRQGMEPKAANLYGLARAAGVSVDYLITIIGYEKWSGEPEKDG